MHFNGQQLSGALKEFSITLQILGSKINYRLLLLLFEGVLSALFRIEVQVISNPSSRLEKKTKPLNFCL